MSSVQCPMSKRIRPMLDCLTCDKHIKDGASIEWCGYRAPAPPPKEPGAEIPINALEMQLRKKTQKAEYFYQIGKTRIADRLSDEAAHLEIEIRRIRSDERKDA